VNELVRSEALFSLGTSAAAQRDAQVAGQRLDAQAFSPASEELDQRLLRGEGRRRRRRKRWSGGSLGRPRVGGRELSAVQPLRAGAQGKSDQRDDGHCEGAGEHARAVVPRRCDSFVTGA
jgi:hypothetical protein